MLLIFMFLHLLFFYVFIVLKIHKRCTQVFLVLFYPFIFSNFLYYFAHFLVIRCFILMDLSCCRNFSRSSFCINFICLFYLIKYLDFAYNFFHSPRFFNLIWVYRVTTLTIIFLIEQDGMQV